MTIETPRLETGPEVAPTEAVERLIEVAVRALARTGQLAEREDSWRGPALASLATQRLQLADAATAHGRWLTACHHYRHLEALLPKLPANAPSRALFELAPSEFPWRVPCRTPGRVKLPADVGRLLVERRWSQLHRASRRQLPGAPRVVRGALYDVLAFTSLRLCQPGRASDWLARRIALELPDGPERYAWRYWLWSRALVARGRLPEARDLLLSTVVLFHRASSPERSMLVLEYLLNVDEALGIKTLREALAEEIRGSAAFGRGDAHDWERRFGEISDSEIWGVS